MAVERKSSMTVAAFDVFANQPENADQILEYIAGEVFVVPSNPYVSEIASLISFFIRLFLRENHLKGHVTGEAGGYMVAGERYAPDVGYLARDRQPELVRKGYNPNPPDLAVEIISDPDNRQEQYALRTKLVGYLSAGVVVWIVNPEECTVEVHRLGEKSRRFDQTETLSGGDVLPGFKLAVKDIFPDNEN